MINYGENMKVLLCAFNAKYIHKALSLRWLYVAKDPSIETEIMEFTLKDDLNQCAFRALEKKPDVIAISTYIWSSEAIKKWIVLLKQIKPELRIFVGGPEVSYEFEEWLDLPIEAVLRGEGEKTLWQAIRKEQRIDGYASKEWVSDVPYAKVELSWLETLESPYFLDFDLKDSSHRYFYFETSRGCPYRCSYCLSSLDDEVRFFSKEYIEAQLTRLKEVAVKQVKFLDRTFNANPSFSLWIARLIESLNLKTSFQFEIVADRLNQEMLDFLVHEAERSHYRFEAGVQSFNNKTLKAVGRIQNNEKLKEILSFLSKEGYIIHADLIAGLPYENYTSFRSSYDQLFLTGVDEIQVGILKLLKGTSIRTDSKQLGLVSEKKPPYDVLSTPWISLEEMKRIHDAYHATEKFYNSARFRHSLGAFLSLGWIDSPFEFMVECGKRLNELKAPYQLSDLYLLVKDVMKNHDEELVESILLTDYMMQFKQRPPKIFTLQNLKERKEWIHWLSETKGFDEDWLSHYTSCCAGYYKQKRAVQMVIYNAEHQHPKRIWITSDKEVIEEE
ncbi:MAG: DUF4080 domain-containing protein [Erysipelotrichaceae bacterium]|nr:DUF4080 domain-containing protein [Erysipelotrichaceae bacterium]